MKPSERHVYIINPNAIGARTWARCQSAISRMYAAASLAVSYDFQQTESYEDVTHKTQQAAAEGATSIVAVGGDGTIQTVARALFDGDAWQHPNCSLAALRAGSGSDYIRSICPSSAEESGNLGIQPVDVVQCTFLDRNMQSVSEAAPQLFINMASLGLTANIVLLKEEWQSWLPRWARYILPTLVAFPKRKNQTLPWRCETTAEGQWESPQELLAITIGKGRFAGGGMKLAERSQLANRLLEVTLFEPHSLPAFLGKIPKLYGGGLWSSKAIHKRMLKQFVVDIPAGSSMEFDGELVRLHPDVHTLQFSVLPKAMPVNFELTRNLRRATGR